MESHAAFGSLVRPRKQARSYVRSACFSHITGHFTRPAFLLSEQGRIFATRDGAREKGIYHTMSNTKHIRRVAPASGDTLINAIPQLVWIVHPDGWWEYVNQRWSDYTRLTLEQIQSDRWAHLQLIHPDDREGSRVLWQHALDTGGLFEHEGRTRNGQTGEYRW